MTPQIIAICKSLADSAVDFLVSRAENGGFAPYDGGLPNAMTTAEVVSASLETGHRFPLGLLEEAVARLVEWQQADGSWTDPNSKDPWDVSSTAWSAWALWRWSPSSHRERCQRAAAWLSRLIGPEGGSPTNALQSTPNTYATAYAFRALRALAAEQAARLSLAFLSQTQNDDGGWGLGPGEASESTLTAYVLHGLADAHVPTQSRMLLGGLSYLDKARDTEGLWGSWLDERQSVEGTAFCLYVRSRNSGQAGPLELAALQYIARRVKDGSAWKIHGRQQTWVAVSVLLAAHELGTREAK